MSNDAPIGVFDSGLGGLTVVREIRRELPHEKIIYFGDVARLPYGIKSVQQIRQFSKENTDFLIRANVKVVVVACNSSSSAAFSYLRSQYRLPIIDVIEPAAEEALRITRNRKIGVIATQATVSSKAYERAIRERNSKARVFSNACPLLVPLVEEGILDGSLAQMVLNRYLDPLRRKGIDTLILGCTHYPLLYETIQREVGARIQLIDSAPQAVRELKRVLKEKSAFQSSERSGRKLQVFVSDAPAHFLAVGSKFLGEPLTHVKVVRFRGEVTENGRWDF